MQISTEDFIEKEEWGKPIVPTETYKAYWDSAGGVWTLGPGLTHGITRNTVMTGVELEKAYLAELQPFINDVAKQVHVPLTQNQRTVLVSFCYNVGDGNLLHSTLLRDVNAGKLSLVPEELRKWVHGAASHAVVPGLINRRNAEIRLWNTPDDHPSVTAENYVPLHDAANPGSVHPVSQSMAEAAMANPTVSVPLSTTNAVVSRLWLNVSTAFQAAAVAFFGSFMNDLGSLATLKGIPAWVAGAIAVALQVYQDQQVKASNSATGTLVSGIQADAATKAPGATS